jgi:TonB-dependent starch-binding outer membrane protein SusC
MDTTMEYGMEYYKRMMFLAVMMVVLAGAGHAQTFGSLHSFQEEARDLYVEQGMGLAQALDLLEQRYNVVFLYKTEAIANREVNRTSELPRNMENALQFLLDEHGLNFRYLSPKTYGIFPDFTAATEKESVLEVQDETVRGRVVDAQTGEALPGVNVVIDGSTTGTSTDMAGEFELQVPNLEETLVFSYVGYFRLEIAIENRNVIDVEMEPDVHMLDDIVVVGYGEQRRVNLTGSVSSVNFDDAMESRPLTNASQAIGGKVPGVWVSQNSGKPGDDGAQLRVRGWGTMSDASPLVIIDGVEGSIDHINPNDIQSISVLKDAASAAIYGSKAANGVVLITTKQGQYADRMSVNINSYTGMQSLGRRFNLINDSAEMMEMLNLAHVNVGGSERFPQYLINEFREGTDPYRYPNTDWYEHLYRNAMMQEHNISVSGGSETTSMFFSFNYLDQEGIILNTNSERFGLRANLETTVSDRITVGGRMNYINQNSEEPYYPLAVYGPMVRVYNIFETSAPFIAPYTEDGRLGAVQAIDRDGVILYENNNPLIDANNGLTTSGQNTINVNAYTNINLTDNLNWRTTVASSGRWSIVDRHNETVFGYTDAGVARTSRNLNREGIEVIRGHNERIDRQVYSTLNFTDNFGQNEVSALAGMQLEDLSIKTLFARRSDPPKEGLTQIDAGTSGVIGEGNMNRLRMFSYFGRVNYSYADKYLLEGNIRADASSRFREGNRWGVFPGFSAGWRLIEEDFIRDLNIFSDLKLRASWGKLGNQNIAGYWPYLPVINQTNALSYSYGGSFSPGAAITQMVDENITWETTTSFDVGIELGFFDNRLRFEADYYDKLTEGILVSLPIPFTLGDINPPVENIGEMTNKGFEFSIAYNNWALEHDQLGYSIELNLTTLNNEVTKFRGGDSPDQLFLVREGYSYQTLYGYKVEGIYQSDEEAAEHMHSSGFTPRAGDLRFQDVNNDGQIGFQDRQELGNTIPRFTFGINPTISYKGFDLNAVLQGAAGVHVWTQNALTTVQGDGATTLDVKWRDAWTPENPDTNVPALRVDYSWNNQQSSYWVEEISFLKLKNIQLGYSLPTNITSMLGSQRIYLYANAQNVGTLVSSSYNGYDPERSTFDSGVRHYPIPRIISFGINIEL